MSRRFLLTVLLLALLPVSAAADGYRFAESESRLVRLNHPMERVLVANPEVASVKALNSRELLVSGLQAGKTELVVWYSDGSRQQHIGLDVTPDPARLERLRSDVAGLLQQLDPQGKARIEVRNDRVVLSGSVPNAKRGERLETALKELGYPVLNLMSVEGSQQVQIFVRVAEVIKGRPIRSGIAALDKKDRYGLFPPGNLGTSTPFSVNNVLSGLVSLAIPHNDAFQVKINPDGASAFGLLSLMEGHNLARVLAQPTLVVESGQTAKFLAGGEVPIPIAQKDSTITVEYKEFGVLLEFTPTLLDDDMIAMHIAPEVSSLSEAAGIQLGSIIIPGFRTRRAETTVRVRDGESFVIGGLLQDDMRSVVNKVPLLGDIPILGALFRSSSYENDQSELAIVVTPRIVNPIPAGEKIVLPGENLAQPSVGSAILLGKLAAIRPDATARYPIDEAGLEMPQ